MNIAEKQLEAFNAKNIDLFLTYYSKDFKAYMLEQDQLITNDRQHLAEIMQNSFKDGPQVRSEIISSITQGNLIFQQEKIYGHGSNIITSVSIYEVIDDLITRIWFAGRTTENNE